MKKKKRTRKIAYEQLIENAIRCIYKPRQGFSTDKNAWRRILNALMAVSRRINRDQIELGPHRSAY